MVKADRFKQNIRSLFFPNFQNKTAVNGLVEAFDYEREGELSAF